MCKPIRPSIAAKHGGREVAANGRRYVGCGGRRRARTAGCRPYGGKVPALSLRASAHTGVAIRNPRPPSLFPMFSNGNLKTPQFSILNSQFSIRPGGRQWRSMTAATAGAAGGAGRGRQGAVPTAGGSRLCHCEGRYGPWP